MFYAAIKLINTVFIFKTTNIDKQQQIIREKKIVVSRNIEILITHTNKSLRGYIFLNRKAIAEKLR